MVTERMGVGSLEKDRVFRTIFLMVVWSWASIKVILPALPKLQHALAVDDAHIKLSVTVFLLIVSLAQLLWGALAAFYTTRRLILCGLGIALLGSFLSMTAVTFPMYFLGRGLEGLGLGCISPLTRALLANIFSKREFAGRASLLSICTAVLPAVSSLAGGYIMTLLGWRAIFACLVVLNLLVIAFTLKYVRELPAAALPLQKSKVAQVGAAYLQVLKSRCFWGFITPYAILFGALIGFYSASPFWFVNVFGFAHRHFSNLLLPTAAALTLGLFIARRLIRKWPVPRVMWLGLLIGAGVFALLACFALAHVYGLWTIVVIFALLGLAIGVVSPCANAETLTRLKTVAAPAAALITCYVFAMSSFFSHIMMRLEVRHAEHMVYFIGLVVTVSMLTYWLLIYRRLPPHYPGQED